MRDKSSAVPGVSEPEATQSSSEKLSEAQAAVIEWAHQAVVNDARRFIEQQALFTRTGPQGIRQVNVRGKLATEVDVGPPRKPVPARALRRADLCFSCEER
jgi:hypothetical protein